MQGKIKFKLSKDPFFNKRIYKIFVNDNLVGEVSNKNSVLDAVVNYGKQTVRIEGKNYAKILDLNVGPANIINPVYISHSRTYGIKLPSFIRYAFITLSILASIFLVYNVIIKGESYPSYFLILFFFILSLTRYNEKEFKIHKDRFSLS